MKHGLNSPWFFLTHKPQKQKRISLLFCPTCAFKKVTEKRVPLQKPRNERRKDGEHVALGTKNSPTNNITKYLLAIQIYPLVFQKRETEETDNGKTGIHADILIGESR